MQADPLAQAVTANAVTVFDSTTHQSFTSIAVTQPVLTGDLAGRVLAITAGRVPSGQGLGSAAQDADGEQ